MTDTGRGTTAPLLRRAPVMVLAAGCGFALLATALTVAAAAQRRHLWEQWAPRVFESGRAQAAADGITLPRARRSIG